MTGREIENAGNNAANSTGAASFVGAVGKELLGQDQAAAVLGLTSRGLFLRLACGWVIFLSIEAYRGPLTVNVPLLDTAAFPNLLWDENARVSQGQILFPASGGSIQTGQARVWASPPRLQPALPPGRRSEIQDAFARLAAADEKRGRLNSGHPGLAGFDACAGLATRLESFSSSLELLEKTLVEGQPLAIAAAVEPFLGLGPGLTPAGDDLVLGLLLSLNRWGDILAPRLDLPALAQEILPRAYRKTTTLSANLIECATRGEADERLIDALDSVMTGVPEAAVAAARLRGWGSTSGIAALAGICFAVRAWRSAV
jgi:hypothetical protein